MSSAAAARIPMKERPPKPMPEPEPRIQILKDGTVHAVADLINAQKIKNIIVMTGAGISTAAGIKDFRSPGTGLYSDLEKYNLPFPEAVFDLDFFKPTLTHYLLPLLAEKNLLLRSYTQNIDSLERLAGLDEDLLVEAHGSFATSKCVQCEMTSDSAWVKKHIMDGDIPYCQRCSGLVKPGITFFGESLPLRFTKMVESDFESCDLLIVLGTSLKVEPFNKLIAKVSPRCPRLLINREKAGEELHSGFDFDDKLKYTFQRDSLFLGSCDEGVKKLAALCGWEDELQALYDAGHARLNAGEKEEDGGIGAANFMNEEEEDVDSELEEDDLEDSEVKAVLKDSDSELFFDEITQQLERSRLFSQDFSGPNSSSPDTTDMQDGVEAVESTETAAKTHDDLEGGLKLPPVKSRVQSSATTSVMSSNKIQEQSTEGREHKGSELSAIKDKVENNDRPLPSDIQATESKTTGLCQSTELHKETLSDNTASIIDTVDSTATPNAELTTIVHVLLEDSKAPKMMEKESAKTPTVSKIEGGSKMVSAVSSITDNSTADCVQTLGFDASAKSLASGSFSLSLESSRMPVISQAKSGPTADMKTLSASSPLSKVSSVIPANTASIFQSVSTCIPVENVSATAGSEIAKSVGSTYNPFSSNMNFNFGSYSGDLSNTSTASRDGLGILQMIRRKRRKDFESVACGGSMKSEYRYLRGHGTLHPHYLTCGRVTKRPRFV
ncbi:NAD-dependent protein deacetylase sirtuin-2 [Mortierella sp. GBA30]|nr:NAD-dependent protein deacetylase sirtuin-2 [Mortierella sp. GBA30]